MTPIPTLLKREKSHPKCGLDDRPNPVIVAYACHCQDPRCRDRFEKAVHVVWRQTTGTEIQRVIETARRLHATEDLVDFVKSDLDRRGVFSTSPKAKKVEILTEAGAFRRILGWKLQNALGNCNA